MPITDPNENRYVSPSTLDPREKQRVWEHIKVESPGLAELLTDPAFRSLVERFDGTIEVRACDCPQEYQLTAPRPTERSL